MTSSGVHPGHRIDLCAKERGCAEVFLWALPQVLRDGLTIFGEEPAVSGWNAMAYEGRDTILRVVAAMPGEHADEPP